eukprot:CAMPEP_0172778458 /NCGR_PEP_ID=MMETSP1074-20121228/201913_1 /TAXON_ID=2916 /ORGANISM="Ceratium fusus, Strain PA161109" /LENGTH=588 /DNA_ID=CAMNT_0013615393 /DNA_START=52 /DNA_END=1819 /DNA_ORIENTATION=-
MHPSLSAQTNVHQYTCLIQSEGAERQTVALQPEFFDISSCDTGTSHTRTTLASSRSCRGPWRTAVAGVVLLLVTALVATVSQKNRASYLGLRGHSHAGFLLSNLVEAVSIEGDSASRCHTATIGERCHTDVIWAMRKWKDHSEWYINITERSTFKDFQNFFHHQIEKWKDHSEWYINITERSTFKDFQNFFHHQIENDGSRRCPRPCDYRPQLQDGGARKGHCHTAKPGEECYNHVIYTQRQVAKYKDLYSGILNANSSFEDVQHFLSHENQCPEPCDLGSNKSNSSAEVEGPPEWYINITEKSTFEDYQCFFHQQIQNDGTRRCPRPCDYHPQAPRKGNCHTAKPGEECYNHVIYTQRQVAKYKDLYSGILNANSSFEDVQHFLSHENQCPEPCDLGSNKSNSSAITTCHTARPGESCFSDILFAKNTLIEQDASWFRGSGLTQNSSNDDFQAVLHNQGHVGQCPKPCDRAAESRAEFNLVCETALSGECYDSVMQAATRGIKEHPERYRRLTKQSNFEDFQLHIYTGPNPKCSKPPCPCQNAAIGDECHSSIEWVKTVGLKKHPKDFDGLTPLSSDLDVQRFLHEN